jgi:hypothetical protein
MSKINEFLPSYLTPIGISKDKGRINTENFEALKEDEILEFYKNILIKPQDKTFIEKKEKKKSKLRIRRPRKLRTLDKFKTVVENLGDNSSFVNAEEDYKKSKTLKLPKQIKNAFSLRDLPERSFQDYSLNNRRFRERILKTPEKSIEIPLSIKTLMVAENTRTKNSEILTKTDFISNYKTFPTFDIFYNTPIKVEFTTDGKNWELLTQTKYNNLRENIICRLSYYYYQGLTYKKDLPIANEYFVILGSRLKNNRRVTRNNNVDSANLINLSQAVSGYNLTYSTTNLISQPQSRNTAFGTRGEATTQELSVDASTTVNPSTSVSVAASNSQGGLYDQ